MTAYGPTPTSRRVCNYVRCSGNTDSFCSARAFPSLTRMDMAALNTFRKFAPFSARWPGRAGHDKMIGSGGCEWMSGE